MPRKILFCFIIAVCLIACQSDKSAPAQSPAPAVPAVQKKAEAMPDIIRIALWFIRFEGVTSELTQESGRVINQDKDAYYVGFMRKIVRPQRCREVVVKVYKKNGLAEWEDF
jgi:hypothetical protein